ncbi:MAG: hypothetical protein IPN29_19585 [Saprospiraceae bacterium]|nr:hypothetical protein [Saprospiraceae bacterium]
MISIFRRNIFINSILLLPYIAILRLKSVASGSLYPEQEIVGTLNKMVFSILSPSPFIHGLLAIFILFFDALIINRLVIKNHLFRENNLVSGMIFALLASMPVNLLQLSPEIMCTPFLLLAMQAIFNSYNNIKSADDIFLSGFYTAIAALFYTPATLLIVFCYLSFVIMRSFTATEKMQLFSGWLVPLFLMASGEYYARIPITNIFVDYGRSLGLGPIFTTSYSLSSLLILLFIGMLTFIVLINFTGYMAKKVIAAQKRISILFWYMLFIAIMVVTGLKVDLNILVLYAIPVGIFLTFTLLDMKNKILPELIHLFLILLLVINHLELIKIN